jgi:hypothetical protein
MEFLGGETIRFSDYLPTGSGFLGVLSSFSSPSYTGYVKMGTEVPGGTQTFGMDNVTYAIIPIPAAAWLFGSGVIGLIAFAKRRKST